MGFGVWALIKGLNPPHRAGPLAAQASLLWAVAALVLGGTATAVLWWQERSGWNDLFNPAMLVTMLGLAVLFPTPVQGALADEGTTRERARRSKAQMQAQALALRAAILALMAAGAVSHYGGALPSLPVLVAGMLTGLATLYNGALWWTARGDDPPRPAWTHRACGRCGQWRA